MRRYPPPSAMTASFGPGPLTPAVKWLLISNIALFLVTSFWPDPVRVLGLRPADVWGKLEIWQVVTYMFLHANLLHVGFNMLALWMFGVELERLWGTRFFARYYAITGIGAGLCVMLVSVFSLHLAQATTIGASGAIFGLLMAYALYFPHRQILLFLLFPVSSRVFVAIVGAVNLYSAMTATGAGVAYFAHLGGLAVGYLYLKSKTPRFHPVAEIKYRYLKWKINRVKRKFDVYSGGRADDVNRRIH
jgi:membrane associated rhomboid family serine protease